MHDDGTRAERVPLLGSPDVEELPRFNEAAVTKSRSDRLQVIVITFVCFISVFGEYLFLVPSPRIFEDIICRHYYNSISDDSVVIGGKIDESLCKKNAIQEELAIVIGGLQMLENLPCLLFALPYGLLADRIGRKRVLLLALCGILLQMSWQLVVCWFPETLPLRLVWIAPLFMMIGGGDAIATNMVYAMISDLCTDSTR